MALAPPPTSAFPLYRQGFAPLALAFMSSVWPQFRAERDIAFVLPRCCTLCLASAVLQLLLRWPSELALLFAVATPRQSS